MSAREVCDERATMPLSRRLAIQATFMLSGVALSHIDYRTPLWLACGPWALASIGIELLPPTPERKSTKTA